MQCDQGESISNEEFLRRFRAKAFQRRIPISGGIALTHRCNLKCCHCYAGPLPASHRAQEEELPTTRVLSIIDEITEAGCLTLLLTGGEPLLRKDFPQIYRHARENGLLVVVFTNGTLITDSTLQLFQSYPPQFVEITLYGATASTYERITGTPDSYKRCMESISKLQDADVPLRLKTMLMKYNCDEFSDIKKFAEQLGVRFRFDPGISPRLNGDKSPLGFRVSPGEIMKAELSDENRADAWRKFLSQQSDTQLVMNESLYQCGAGMIGFHIDPYGCLQPCLMVTKLKYDLRKGNFADGWNRVMPQVRKTGCLPDPDCVQCKIKFFCDYCPAFFGLENGAENAKSDFLCNTARLRYRVFKENVRGMEDVYA